MKYPFNVISSIIPPSSSSFTAPLLPPVLPHAGGDKWLGSIYFNLAHRQEEKTKASSSSMCKCALLYSNNSG